MSNSCSRCAAALGASCCQAPQGEALATLTLVDVERIRDALRLRPDRFSEIETLDDEEARRYEERRPLYSGYFRHGPFRWTLKVVRGACVFFDAASGCRLSEALRPTACRLYPFDVLASGDWGLQVQRGGDASAACLAVEEADSFAGVQSAFRMSPEILEALAEQLRAEVREHARRTPP